MNDTSKNMTPTPWFISGSCLMGKKGNFASTHILQIDTKSAIQPSEADSQAILTAVNNTYGLEINPEGVKALLDFANSCVGLQPWISDSELKKSFTEKLTAALESAKLK